MTGTRCESGGTSARLRSAMKNYLSMDFSTKTLAKGCFGKVYKQKYGDTWAALKKVPVNVISKEQLTRECSVYEKAQHTNVVRLLGKPWLDDGKWHIPLEFIFGEDLETAIFSVQKSKIQLTQSVKANVITGMCEGLTFLHTKDIVHQDLKPDNIMVEHGSHRAVIIDMGLAKFFRNGLSSAINLGNEAYAAPEIQQGNVRDKRSDVWAMGKMTAELCARVRLPTNSVNPIKIKESLKENPYCNVVSRMVIVNAAERASMFGVIGEIRQLRTIYGGNQGATQRPIQGTNHGPIQGAIHMPIQGANHGPIQGANHVPIQGANHGPIQGAIHMPIQGANHGPIQGANHVPIQGANHGPIQGANHLTGAIKPQAGLGAQLNPCRTGAEDFGAKQKWRPPTPFPPEAKKQEIPVERPNRSPSPRPQLLIPINTTQMANQFSNMSIPCALPPDGEVVHRRYDDKTGQMEIKHIVTRNGKVIKYEDMKITK
ncbi:CBL-interacting serine/threonine-protein kinase 25-like [Silurus asotus]|uniref:CBL-interacting serine/threonine-protein kinase 25-like n=1 Tax=Silurus asotus TaxID=30991 RepID=A0AAD5A9A5_SILAS|nr:CBL-interacting serine/threonine-protein kinase 25-like [Silurus asotus]